MFKQRMENHLNNLQSAFNAISRLEDHVANLTYSMRVSETRLAEVEDSQAEFIEEQNRMAARMFIIDQDLTQTLVSQLPHISLQKPSQQ